MDIRYARLSSRSYASKLRGRNYSGQFAKRDLEGIVAKHRQSAYCDPLRPVGEDQESQVLAGGGTAGDVQWEATGGEY